MVSGLSGFRAKRSLDSFVAKGESMKSWSLTDRRVSLSAIDKVRLLSSCYENDLSLALNEDRRNVELKIRSKSRTKLSRCRPDSSRFRAAT